MFLTSRLFFPLSPSLLYFSAYNFLRGALVILSLTVMVELSYATTCEWTIEKVKQLWPDFDDVMAQEMSDRLNSAQHSAYVTEVETNEMVARIQEEFPDVIDEDEALTFAKLREAMVTNGPENAREVLAAGGVENPAAVVSKARQTAEEFEQTLKTDEGMPEESKVEITESVVPPTGGGQPVLQRQTRIQHREGVPGAFHMRPSNADLDESASHTLRYGEDETEFSASLVGEFAYAEGYENLDQEVEAVFLGQRMPQAQHIRRFDVAPDYVQQMPDLEGDLESNSISTEHTPDGGLRFQTARKFLYRLTCNGCCSCFSEASFGIDVNGDNVISESEMIELPQVQGGGGNP